MKVTSTEIVMDDDGDQSDDRERFRIPEENYGRLTEKIAALNRRAVKLDFPEITLVIERIEDGHRYHEILGKIPQRFYHVHLTGEAPVIAGWTLVGTLQGAGEAGVILRAVPGQTFPLEYRRADPEWCDHCRTRRRRTETFVLRHEDGTHKQVGRQCIADFLGHQSPQRLAQYAEWLSDAYRDATSAGVMDVFDPTKGIPIGFFLGWVAEAILRHGWTSRTKAQELNQRGTPAYPTANRAWSEMIWWSTHTEVDASDEYRTKHVEHWRPSEAAIKDAQDALDFARTYFAEKDAESLNDYLHNLRVILAAGVVVPRGSGLTASIIGWWRREIGRAAEESEKRRLERDAAATLTHVGTVGKREVFVLTLIDTKHLESDWGVTDLHIFRDPAGNRVAWFASGGRALDGDHTYRIKGTVKAHDTYRDMPQTTLTRCMIVEDVTKLGG